LGTPHSSLASEEHGGHRTPWEEHKSAPVHRRPSPTPSRQQQTSSDVATISRSCGFSPQPPSERAEIAAAPVDSILRMSSLARHTTPIESRVRGHTRQTSLFSSLALDAPPSLLFVNGAAVSRRLVGWLPKPPSELQGAALSNAHVRPCAMHAIQHNNIC